MNVQITILNFVVFVKAPKKEKTKSEKSQDCRLGAVAWILINHTVAGQFPYLPRAGSRVGPAFILAGGHAGYFFENHVEVLHVPEAAQGGDLQIGRASCRERV